MIVAWQEILAFTGESDTAKLEMIHKGIEGQVKNWMDWNPEETTHTNKLYDGEDKRGGVYDTIGDYISTVGCGKTDLFLDEKYVSTVTRVGERIDGIRIKNTSTDATNAYVTIDIANDTISCVQEGGTNAGTNTVDLSTDTTLATAVAAINAFGGGWSSEVYDTDYNSYLSSNLLEVDGQFCGAWSGSERGWTGFDMAGQPFDNIRLYSGRGQLYYYLGFPIGRKRIAVSYTSGYSDANMPEDLKLGVMMLVDAVFTRSDAGTMSIQSYSLGHLSVKYGDVASIKTSMEYLNQYRQRVII